MSTSDVGVDADEAAQTGQLTRRRFDWSAVDPSTAVAELLADAADCEPDEIGPLYDTVDSDALDSLVRHGESAADCTVTFPHDGFEVSVSGDGEVLVDAPEPTS
ncbi:MULTISPECIES: HalOD1 output domain-containing protein [Haloarcula]|uniref:HalOD1 output domain-containing protein n=1 Tax=Haloarcula TaxID=2237 RepID=UPI0023ECB9B0|nr:HalOD1 output domain-containing protein [Halomicroarcula sp. XH51]